MNDSKINKKSTELRNHLVNVISKNSPVKFRNRIIKAIKEDSDLDSYLKEDHVVLPPKYTSIINNINGFVMICNYTTGLYEYVSEGIKSCLGYDLEEYSKQEVTNLILSLIHEEHAKFHMNHILPTVLNYFKQNSTFITGKDYRFTWCVKAKNIYNIYDWYLLDTFIIEVDESGFPLKTLITCTNINLFKKDKYIYYNITKKNQNGIYEAVLEGSENSDKNNEYKLTLRELQVISLIAEGYTTKQIAQTLFVSLNTIQTHRKSIMKKTKCNGIADLTNFAFSRGLL